jgi:hypothetical protein
MLFIASWDIPDASWDETNRRMLNCFTGKKWYRPLSTFYIVKVSDLAEYRFTVQEMQTVAKDTGLRFISAALLSYEGWHGWLPQDKWDAIGKIR